MTKVLRDRAIVLVLRASAIVAKFILLQQIAVNVEPVSLSEYTLLQSFIAFSVIVSGLDIYNIKNRRLITGRRAKIDVEFYIYPFGYFIAYVLYFVSLSGEINQSTIVVIFILIGEHLAQESFRRNIIMGHQFNASIIMFLRSTSWAVPLVIGMYLDYIAISVEFVLLCWLVGLCITLVYCRMTSVINTRDPKKAFSKFRRTFVLSILYLKKSFRFYIASTLGRAPLYFDKIVVAYIATEDVSAKYNLYFSLAFVTVPLFDALIGSYSIARLGKGFKNHSEFNQVLLRFIFSTAILYMILYIGIYIVVYILGGFGVQYQDASYTLDLLFLSAFFMVLSQFPHLCLYFGEFDVLVNRISAIQSLVFLVLLALCYLNPIGEPAVFVSGALLGVTILFFLARCLFVFLKGFPKGGVSY